MSQHRISTTLQGHPIQLLMGWDRPLQQFFLSVLPLDMDDEEDTSLTPAALMIQAALTEVAELGMQRDASVNEYQNLLARLGIEVPYEVFVEVQKDGDANTGNRVASYEVYTA